MLFSQMRNCRLIGALAIAFAGAMFVYGQEEKPNDKSEKGTITGRVVNESGRPLANVQVNISSYRGAEGQVVITDTEGKFQASELPPIAYLISVYAAGYVSKPRDPDVDFLGYYHVGESVRLEMIKGGVITGTVSRSNGEPVVAINVIAYLMRDYRGQPPRYS